MRAYQIMTTPVVTVTASTPLADAANLMLKERISGLPVVDAAGKLVGIVSEGDFLRRGEIGTRRKRSAWLEFLVGPGKLATEFVHQEGRTVEDVMTSKPQTVAEDATLEDVVQMMEKNGIKRLPVVRGDALVGIVTRANLLQAVANLSRDSAAPSADDDQLRQAIMAALAKEPWCPMGVNVVVRGGVADLSGVITDDRQRKAAVVAVQNVAGVKAVHDHLCWVDTMSGAYIDSPEDTQAKAS
jgi:CBS domain-containing protein